MEQTKPILNAPNVHMPVFNPAMIPYYFTMRQYLDDFVSRYSDLTVTEIYRLLYVEMNRYGVRLSYNDSYAIFSLGREYDLSMTLPFVFGAISECNGYVVHIVEVLATAAAPAPTSDTVEVDDLHVGSLTIAPMKRVIVDVIPARCLNRFSSILEPSIHHYFDTYDISYVIDGTIVSLYHFDQDIWHISSTNGIDVSKNRWMGEKTFAEILAALFEKYQVPFILGEDGYLHMHGEEIFSYTVGFHCSDFHPIKDREDANYMWQVQTVNKTNNTVVENMMFKHIPKQVIKKFTKLDELFVTDPSNHFHYGYILTSRSIAGPCQRVIVESKFAIRVKSIFYDIEASINKELNSISRKHYIMFRALLTPEYNKFVSQYVHDAFSQYIRYMDIVVEDAIKILTARYGGIVMIPPTGLHANVANTLIGRIMDKSIINKIGNKDYQSVIMDVIKCPGNAKIFALSMT